ncbi:GlxA family transcriptional regulator [Dyella soli]|uniref:GlxA family transcriptional regulator n=1 Tax=Dyella soli TaxID=522319 RepID=A0A4R0YP60_9GAMM|nr:GlxA family transcriptional regulator [Dyella soli]TCI09655.1 GlxA family transcriptional regulator [Dyella soli]
MTKTQENLPTATGPADSPRVVVFLAYPEMGLLDVAGPQTVFTSASQFLHECGSPGYVSLTVSLDGGMVMTRESTGINTRPAREVDDLHIDTIFVPGARNMLPALEDEALVSWLRIAGRRARRVASVCTGAFLLAEADLLCGRRATTHWKFGDSLSHRYPDVAVETNAIYVHDGPVWSSAGVSAGIDLSLALVQEDHGHALTMRVAHHLVLYMHRPGGQAQFSELLRTQTSDAGVFAPLHAWIEKHLGDYRLNVDILAEHAHMSPRNFARSYKEKTGQTPARALELFRLEAARRLLEQTQTSTAEIARKCGFGAEDRMRVAFKRHLKVSPSDYRKHFFSR